MEWLSGYRMVVRPRDGVTDWELCLTATTAQRHESIQQHVTSPGKDQNSKLEVQFLLNVYCSVSSLHVLESFYP